MKLKKNENCKIPERQIKRNRKKTWKFKNGNIKNNENKK